MQSLELFGHTGFVLSSVKKSLTQVVVYYFFEV